MDHGRVDQHGTSGRVIDIGRWALRLDPSTPVGMVRPATPQREFAAAIPDLVWRILERDLGRENPGPGSAPSGRDEQLEAVMTDDRVLVDEEDVIDLRLQGRPRFPVRTLRRIRGCAVGGESRPSWGLARWAVASSSERALSTTNTRTDE
jgi:hypothetical protein